ncbi:p21-Rho-binding domain protein [Necator americanus]|uniref:p21-Rho-binding domain protein n=1 Tax=Necator americanus TaxID=51031 RepID=W2SLY2_NECAM|nr:p21-Rho-binding domain protein [Necator americanus]ETN70635.1 p21-Rho-binding domain protein [Necator americanus]
MSASIPENDGKPPRPTPAPRKLSVNKSSNKPTISAPFNFRHVSHVGIDFASHDVKKAIKPMTKIEEINDPPQPADRGNPDEIDTQRSAIPKIFRVEVVLSDNFPLLAATVEQR